MSLRVVLPWLIHDKLFFCLSLPFLPNHRANWMSFEDIRDPIVIELSERALVLFLVFGSQSVQDSNPRPVNIQQLLHYNIVGLCFIS
jgi:hypothetical protein